MTNFYFDPAKDRCLQSCSILRFYQKSTTFFKTYLSLFILLLALNTSYSQTLDQSQKRTSILGLQCMDVLNVTLEEACSFLMTPDMVISGGLDTIDSYVITIDGQVTDLIVGCGDHTYTIELIDNDEVVFSCTGNLLAEDITAPIVSCPDNTNTATIEKQMQQVNGALEETDEQIEWINFSCSPENAVPGPHFYDIYTFQVTTTDVYTFIGELMDTDFDATISLFSSGDIQENNPCPNMLVHKEMLHASPANTLLSVNNRLSMPLVAGEEYTLMVSSRSAANAVGHYNIFAFADNMGMIESPTFTTTTISLPITTALVCTDLDNVLLSSSEEHHYMVDANGMLLNESISEELFSVLNHTGFPDISANCGEVDVWVTDVVIENGDCGDRVITRTFSIADRAGDSCAGTPQTDECSQVITLRKPNVNDVFLSPLYRLLYCDVDYPTDGEMGGEDDNPDALTTGYPFLMTAFGYQALSDDQCTIEASYTDEPRIDVCESVYKFRREWSITDWCDPLNNFVFQQYVKVGDNIGPIVEVTIPDYDNNGEADERFILSTTPFDCHVHWTTPTAIAVDGNGCSEITSRTAILLDANGNWKWQGSEGSVITFPTGNYTMIWCIEDACGNETCLSVEVWVRDQIVPSANCNQNLNVSIETRVFASNIGANSNDNCSAVVRETRRNYWQDNTCHESADEWSPWGEYVDFYCCDINQEITIQLRVTDDTGNQDSCEMTVVPEDNLTPYCHAPAAVTLFYDELPLEFPNDLEQAYEDDFVGTSTMMSNLFGYIFGTDNCALDSIVELTPQINISDCGWGMITRRFETWQWMAEGDVNNNGVIDREEAWISENDCMQLITIIESCDQIVAPTLIVGEYGGETDECSVLEVGQFGDADGYCEATINIPFEIIGDCSISQTDGNLGTYTITADLDLFVVDENNDGVIDTNEFMVEEGEMGDVSMNIVINTDGTYAIIGAYPIISNAMGDGIYHAIHVFVQDDCGHQVDKIVHFDVIDCKRPDVSCVTEKHVTLLPASLNRCELQVEASDFFAAARYDCTGQGPEVNASGALLITKYAIYHGNEVLNPAIFQADPNHTNITLRDNGFENIYLYAFDEDGYSNFCEVLVIASYDSGCTLSDQEQTQGIVSQTNDENTASMYSQKTEKQMSAFELYQNTPNPFTNESIISFSIPTNSEVRITLTDLRGRKIHTIQAEYFAGFNEVKIKKEMLHGVTGVLNYTLVSGDYIATKRMIVLE